MKKAEFTDFATPMVREPVDDSLILWYNGRGSRTSGTTLSDLSKKGNTGTLTGATWKTAPMGQSILNFDGSDYVDIAALAAPTNHWSVSFWFKTTSIEADMVILAIDTNNAYLDVIGMDVGNIAYARLNGVIKGETVADYNDGIWHHCVVDSANNKVYIDGVSVSMQVGTMFRISTKRVIGARYSAAAYSQYFTGRLDDIRIYKRTLTSNEIMEIYQENVHLFGVN